MTTDRFEEMARQVINSFCWEDHNFDFLPSDTDKDWVNKIASALRTAHSEGVREGMLKAAEIANTKILVFKGKWITNDVREFREQIAKAIRSQAERKEG